MIFWFEMLNDLKWWSSTRSRLIVLFFPWKTWSKCANKTRRGCRGCFLRYVFWKNGPLSGINIWNSIKSTKSLWIKREISILLKDHFVTDSNLPTKRHSHFLQYLHLKLGNHLKKRFQKTRIILRFLAQINTIKRPAILL